ncbi:MAG: hypothetical protein IPM79_21315 [Polyangiaceae bacterium]|nr:hypothetical protein [Polyangiaceae bacterium]MBK8940087.1 hypothetical protein [Polyangiaceae bacterium]
MPCPCSPRAVLPALLAVALAGACGDDTTATGGSGGEAGTPSSGGGGESSGGGGMGGQASGGGGSTANMGGAGGSGGCADSLELMEELPPLLSETGLYADIASDEVAPNIRPFEPQFPLWTDAADKRRWIYLPECAQIDTTDMDHWELPVGARVYKEFTRDGTRVETRVILRTGPASGDYKFGAYIWNDSGDADLNIFGQDNANDTDHDVPPQTACAQCHRSTGRVLGFSALQLSHDLPGETMASLSAEGKLTVPAPDGFEVPGDATDVAALGVLHANCGSCHHVGGVLPTLDLDLRLRTTDATVESTGAFTSAVNQLPNMYTCGSGTACGTSDDCPNGETCAPGVNLCRCDLVEPGYSAGSALILRMGIRGQGQMPPLGTELVDAAGLAAVQAWIDALPVQ